MTRYHPNSMRTLGKDLTEEEVTPYHVMAYNIHIDPNDNTAIPPRQCPKRDSNMVRTFALFGQLLNLIHYSSIA